MDKKVISRSFNNSKLDKTMIQSEGTQINETNQGLSEQAFIALFKEIEAIEDPGKRNTAQYLAEELKEAHESNDDKKGSRIIGLLKETLTHSASLAQIASLFVQ